MQVASASPSKMKVGAVLLSSKGKVLTTAVNQERKSHPIQARIARSVGHPRIVFLHAEVAALLKLRHRQAASTVIVARLGGVGASELRMSRPCPVCEAYLRQHGVKDVYYSVTNDTWSHECWEKEEE